VLAPPFHVLAEEKGLNLLSYLGQSVPDAAVSNGIVTSDQKIKSRPEEVQRMVRASLKALYAYRRDKLAAIEFLAGHFEISAKTAAKVYPNAVDILTSDGQISQEKLRQILDMMQDTGRKEPSSILPNELLNFSFLHAAQKEIAAAASGVKRLR
jgi:ABC-type nitrate/sulfonate/bicarbonate transport system substrate-binding protein